VLVCLRPLALYLVTIGSKSMSFAQKKYNTPRPLPPRPLPVDLPHHRLVPNSCSFTYSQPQSQSHLKSPQEKQQSEPVCAWSAHAPPFGQSPSPFLRQFHALSTSATSAGKLFLFGGYVHGSWSRSPSNDLYVISTRDFSTTLLQTSGDVPNPRYGHNAVLTSTTTLLIWGGRTDFREQNARHQSNDDSFYLLNLGASDLFDVKIRSG
jgi:hypothetical protein